MAIYTSTDGTSGLLPTDYGPLIVRPLEELSAAMRVSTTVTTGSSEFSVPIVTDDPPSAWANEGDELNVGDGAFETLNVTPRKVGGLTVVSREMANDSSPAVAEIIGRGLARSIATRVDQAFVGGQSSPAPQGLSDQSDVAVLDTGELSNLDVVAEAQSMVEQAGGTADRLLVSPADALTLATLKTGEGSAAPLLGTDVTEPGSRRVLGLELVQTPSLSAGTFYVLDSRFSLVVMREQVTVERSEHARFTSDEIVVRATMRLAFAYPHPATIVRVNHGNGDD